MLGEAMYGTVALLSGLGHWGADDSLGCQDVSLGGFGIVETQFVGPMPDGSNQGKKTSLMPLVVVAGLFAGLYWVTRRR